MDDVRLLGALMVSLQKKFNRGRIQSCQCDCSLSQQNLTALPNTRPVRAERTLISALISLQLQVAVYRFASFC